MRTVTLRTAKNLLSRLVDEAAAGEEIVIAKAGKPVAKLVSIESAAAKPRKPGSMRGKVKIHDDFDAPLPPEIARAFGIEP